MKRSDANRTIAFPRATRDEVKAQRIIRPATARPDASLPVGSAMVIVSRAWGGGKGSICEIEVLSKGIGSGVRYLNAMAYFPVTRGSIVSYVRRADGSVEILSGGAGAGSTTNETTITNGNIYPAGWAVSGT